jgi:hypothetical protein
LYGKRKKLISRGCCVWMFQLDGTLHLRWWKVQKNVKVLFKLMEELDGYYVAALWDGKKGLEPPNYEDWACIKIFPKFLRLFYESTMRLLESLCETCNMYIQEVSGIQLHLQEYSDNDDYVLSSMAGKTMSKYNKYWGDLDKVNVLLFIAVILDLQTKLGSLEYWFKDVLSVEQCTDMMIKLKNHL